MNERIMNLVDLLRDKSTTQFSALKIMDAAHLISILNGCRVGWIKEPTSPFYPEA